ncbi:hypothetical protein HAX54_051220 [Datura stramonium]|uniref:Uncharacterized protein n=1 Tax=Datura stramonium TaxID=4076 RepID=A0ABS8WPG8_DATST|nr:hypothetical protein [Datura stramonium]
MWKGCRDEGRRTDQEKALWILGIESFSFGKLRNWKDEEKVLHKKVLELRYGGGVVWVHRSCKLQGSGFGFWSSSLGKLDLWDCETRLLLVDIIKMKYQNYSHQPAADDFH